MTRELEPGERPDWWNRERRNAPSLKHAVEIEERVIAKIATRRDKGRAKYGVSMERADLSELDWLRHAQEEAMDLAVYLEKLIQRLEAKL